MITWAKSVAIAANYLSPFIDSTLLSGAPLDNNMLQCYGIKKVLLTPPIKSHRVQADKSTRWKYIEYPRTKDLLFRPKDSMRYVELRSISYSGANSGEAILIPQLIFANTQGARLAG